jgi:hypothetical protein
MNEPALEVLDALGGLCRLERRDRTLDGSVPLRVVQGCVPFLEGNAFGFQVVLTKELLLERRLRGWGVVTSPLGGQLELRLQGAIPRLRTQGFLGASWARVLSRGVLWSEGNPFHPKLRLWTGLLVRPLGGLWLRLSSPTNRRNVRVSMEPLYFHDGEGFTPLVMDFEPVGSGHLRLAGEIATIAPVAPRATFDVLPLARAPEVGEAHGAFYDAAYFRTKKGDITRKYRKLVGHQPEVEAPGAASCRLIEAGPSEYEVREVGPFLGSNASSPTPTPEQGQGRLQEVIFRNLIPFRVSYDGHTVAVDPDREALEAGARAVERCFAEALGPAFPKEHQGALWYLTKYFTPHPAGEAHFFVKPWSFVTTPPGWSCLLDGIHGGGYDILRGVVSTDLFHATPAVFWLHQLHTSIEVPRGKPLLRVLPVPRALLTAGYRCRRFLDEEVAP